MVSKLLALVALAAGLVMTVGSPAVAEPYSPNILPTSVSVLITSDGPGQPIQITVQASANSATPPNGDIALQISQGSGTARAARSVVAAPIYTKTVHFTGETLTFAGPRLPAGSFLANAAFTPDDPDAFLPSKNTFRFRIASGGAAQGQGQGAGASGGLPNTGGPDLLWLLLGAGLVAVGAGGVSYGRRRHGSVA